MADDSRLADSPRVRASTGRNDLTPSQIEDAYTVAEFVRRNHSVVIARTHDHIETVVTTQGSSNDRLRRDENLQGPATYDESIRVAVACSFHPFTDDLGTFPPGAGPWFVRVRVAGRRVSAADPPLRMIGHPDAPIPVTEAEGWVRAALGDRWADYAYEYSDHREPDAPAASYRFGVILDRTGSPLLAPDNFDWSRIDNAASIVVRKLAPSAGNAVLQQHLLEVGPFAVTAAYLDPRTTPDGRWRINVDNRNADPSALDAFTALTDRLSVRGLVDTRFVPLSLTLNRRTAALVYRLAGSPAIYDADVPIPTESELRTPPTDRTWEAVYGSGDIAFPMTALGWASSLCGFWTEMVAYGRIGDVRAPWSGR